MKKILFALLMLSGCAAVSEPVKIQAAFNHAEYDLFKRDGSNTIKGQAFLRQRGGGIVTCAGNKVLMFPDTPFFREIIKIADNGKKPEAISENWRAVVKKSQCDAQGNFEFTNIPPGPWIILADVLWQVQGSTQGGVVTKFITVNSDMKVLLSDQDL